MDWYVNEHHILKLELILLYLPVKNMVFHAFEQYLETYSIPKILVDNLFPPDRIILNKSHSPIVKIKNM